VIDTGGPVPQHGAVTEPAPPAPADQRPAEGDPQAARARRRRRARRAAAGVVLLALLALEVRSVLWFSSAAPWSLGDRVHVCGRDFARAGHVAAAAAEGAVPGVALQRVASGPLFQPVYGHPAAAPYRALGAPCTMDLYVREGTGYREYGLVGGP
jgi:hypothetical protein